MSSTADPEPISIHISPALRHLAIPLKDFLHNHPQYACLAVGAFVFAPAHYVTSSSPEPTSSRLLLVQRAASEKAFPNLWEVPGGSSEHSDPTILHSVAREVFEETGLHLTRLVRQIGRGVEFSVGRSGGPERWLKLSFEIEVTEIEPAHSQLFGQSHVNTPSQEHSSRGPVEVSLDPNEHQDHRWVSEAEIENAGKIGGLQIVTEDQHAVMLEAFQLHNSNRALVEADITSQ